MDKKTAEDIAELVESIVDIKIKLYDHRNSYEKERWTENIQRVVQLKKELVHKLLS